MAKGFVEVQQRDQKILVKSPYSEDMASRAKRLGGKWGGSRWIFDASEWGQIEQMLYEVYGWVDHEEIGPAEDVLVSLEHAGVGREEGGILVGLGRLLASRRSRDEDIELGPRVALFSGSLPSSGGSTKYPAIGDTDAVLVARKVPKPIADEAIRREPRIYSLAPPRGGRKPGAGRPAIHGEAMDVQINIRLPNTLWKELEKLRPHGMSKAKFCRLALSEWANSKKIS